MKRKASIVDRLLLAALALGAAVMGCGLVAWSIVIFSTLSQVIALPRGTGRLALRGTDALIYAAGMLMVGTAVLMLAASVFLWTPAFTRASTLGKVCVVILTIGALLIAIGVLKASW